MNRIKRNGLRIKYYSLIVAIIATIFAGCSDDNSTKKKGLKCIVGSVTEKINIKEVLADKEAKKEKALFFKQEKMKDVVDSIFTVEFNVYPCEDDNCEYKEQILQKTFKNKQLMMKIGFSSCRHQSYDYCASYIKKDTLKLTLLKASDSEKKSRNGAVQTCKCICSYFLNIKIQGLKKLPRFFMLNECVLMGQVYFLGS